MRQIVAPPSDLGESYDTVAAGFEMPAAVYDWIDSWYGAVDSGWRDRRAAIEGT